jgi:Fe2+ transport system protein FeoA
MFKQSFTVSGSSLKLLKPGEQGVVSRLKGSMDDPIAQKLKALGIIPGVTVAVEQCFPQFIFRVGLSRFALCDRSLSAIYVRVNGSQPQATAQVSSGKVTVSHR